jgi:hypothetical protein
MSSHYFVKEGQEPALLVLDPIPFSAAADLLAWAPLVIVADRALDSVLTWGIKIDVVLNLSGMRNDQGELLEPQQPVLILTANDQITGLRKVFMYLRSVHNSALAILSAHPEEMISSIEVPADLDISIQNQIIRWSRMNHEFVKWLPAGTRVRLFSTSGTLPLMQGAREQNGELITSEDGIVRISPNQPFWIGEFFNS